MHLRKERDDQKKIVTLTEARLERNKKEIEICKRLLDEENNKVVGLNQLRNEIKVLSFLEDTFRVIKDTIMGSMKEELQKATWETFDNMIWKTQTFDRIEIDDNYNISVYDTTNHNMTDSLSATEKTALAYAFILAIHQVSGKNSPLVIDSPLGRVSDVNRERMAEMLLNVSKNKQIVMLFTPDEYSDSVSRMYNNAASIRDLELSADEKYVTGLE